MRSVKALFLILVFSNLSGGCGYTTRAYVERTGYRTIHVEQFTNKINTVSEFSEGNKFQASFPLLETKVTNAVVDQYVFDGNLRIARGEDADLVLKGDVVNYRRESVRTTDDTPQEYRITIVVNIVLSDRKTQQTLWERKSFAGESSYFTTGQFVTSESQAVEDAAKDLSRRIVELTVEAW